MTIDQLVIITQGGFAAVGKRFDEVDRRFDEMRGYVDGRFDKMQKEMGWRFDRVEGLLFNHGNRLD